MEKILINKTGYLKAGKESSRFIYKDTQGVWLSNLNNRQENNKETQSSRDVVLEKNAANTTNSLYREKGKRSSKKFQNKEC